MNDLIDLWWKYETLYWEARMAIAILGTWLALSLYLGWYMWTMPDDDQREIGRMMCDSPTGQAFGELNEAIRELGRTIWEAMTTKPKS